MKKKLGLICRLGLIILLLTSCTKAAKQELSITGITVLQQENGEYQPFQTVNDEQVIEKVQALLKPLKWADEPPTTPADFQFHYNYTGERAEAKVVTYQLWVEHDEYELIVAPNSDVGAGRLTGEAAEFIQTELLTK